VMFVVSHFFAASDSEFRRPLHPARSARGLASNCAEDFLILKTEHRPGKIRYRLVQENS
jgi:hypothetical protein